MAEAAVQVSLSTSWSQTTRDLVLDVGLGHFLIENE